MSMTFQCDIHIKKRGRGVRKKIEPGAAPSQVIREPGRAPRVARLMALALRFEQYLRDGVVANYGELAELEQVSKARISQIMNLLNLAPSIQEEVLFLPRTLRGRDAVQLHQLQTVAAALEWRAQLQAWANPRVVGQLLVSTVFRPQDLADSQAGHDGQGGEWAGDRMPMAYLVAVDRDSGKLVWSRKAAWGFLNRGGVAIGGGKVFCVDLLQRTSLDKWKEAGRKLPDSPPTLYALDLQTGSVKWSKPLGVLVKNIVYSAKRDLLVVPARNLIEWKNGNWSANSRTAVIRSLAGKMQALRGADGSIQWEVAEAPYFDPHVLLDDLIIDRDGITYDLKTGKRAERVSPLTGEAEAWSFKKHGCNHLIACDGLVTWRCAFYDLHGGSGSMVLKGMDAGCTPTLLPAGGLLNLPNFGTHHKRNRMTALALVHVPDNPFWTSYALADKVKSKPTGATPIRRVGYHFGSPGDRQADDGTLWFAVGPKKSQGVVVAGKDLDWFTMHPGQTGHWLGSAGVLGATDVSVPTTMAAGKAQPDKTPRRYDVKLTFVEPAAVKAGQRVFDISLEGKLVLKGLDIAKEAGGSHRPITREFRDVEITGPLDIRLTPTVGMSLLSGVEIREK